jgi:hypothetical protein
MVLLYRRIPFCALDKLCLILYQNYSKKKSAYRERRMATAGNNMGAHSYGGGNNMGAHSFGVGYPPQGPGYQQNYSSNPY